MKICTLFHFVIINIFLLCVIFETNQTKFWFFIFQLRKVLELDLETNSRHWEMHSCTASDRQSIKAAFNSFNKKLLESKNKADGFSKI